MCKPCRPLWEGVHWVAANAARRYDHLLNGRGPSQLKPLVPTGKES